MSNTRIIRSLKRHEEIIESGMKSFMDVGNSLLAIQTEKLYPDEHKSFDAYCKARWGFARAYAYRLMESSVVLRDLRMSPIGDRLLPENEAQARAVADSASDAKTRANVWKAAVDSAPKGKDGKPRVTAAIVKKVAAELVVNRADGKPAKVDPPKSNPEPALPIVGTDTETPPAEREPGDDETEAEHDDAIRDGMEGPVPTKLRPVFAAVSTFRGLQNKVGKLKTGVEDLQRSDAGAALPINELQRMLPEVSQAIKFATPFTECPKCRRNVRDDCKTCVGLGWITEATWNRCKTKEDEQWLKSR